MIAAGEFADRRLDWQNETGRGFYAHGDSWNNVVSSLLMNGMLSFNVPSVDIPALLDNLFTA